LPHGIVTPGRGDRRLEEWKKSIVFSLLPKDLRGKRVLDVGCAEGLYSFECERRGAEVVAIDNLERMKRPDEKQYAWVGNRGFEVAKAILGSNVKFINMDVCDIDPSEMGKFDIVLLLGVLYHLKNPMLALEKLSEVTKEQLIIESECLLTPFRKPLLRYCEGDSYNQDPTCWFIPNILAIQGMLRDAGFREVKVVQRMLGMKGLLRLILHRGITSGRVIVVAYKT